jgi:hypothetical protein
MTQDLRQNISHGIACYRSPMRTMVENYSVSSGASYKNDMVTYIILSENDVLLKKNLKYFPNLVIA